MKNRYRQDVVRFFKKAGHEVYDFKNPPHGYGVFERAEIFPDWRNRTVEECRNALSHPVAQRSFDSDFNGMNRSDVCVLVLPCGRSSHTEAGWMKGTGKRVFVYSPNPQEPELMYKLYDFISGSLFRINEEINKI